MRSYWAYSLAFGIAGLVAQVSVPRVARTVWAQRPLWESLLDWCSILLFTVAIVLAAVQIIAWRAATASGNTSDLEE